MLTLDSVLVPLGHRGLIEIVVVRVRKTAAVISEYLRRIVVLLGVNTAKQEAPPRFAPVAI